MKTKFKTFKNLKMRTTGTGMSLRGKSLIQIYCIWIRKFAPILDPDPSLLHTGSLLSSVTVLKKKINIFF